MLAVITSLTLSTELAGHDLTFVFESTVNATDVGGGTNEPFLMTYTFSPNLVDGTGPIGTGSTIGSYGPILLKIRVGSEIVTGGGEGSGITIFNDAGIGLDEDSYEVRGDSRSFDSTFFGLSILFARVHLIDEDDDATMFSSTELPLSPDFAMNAEYSDVEIHLEDELGKLFFIVGVGSSFTLTPAIGEILVDPIADEDDDPGAGCSLREAVIATNINADYGGCSLAGGTYGADVIMLPSMTYGLEIFGTGEDLAAQGDLDILDDLQIAGAGATTTIIDGNDLDRVFDVVASDVSVTFRDITITRGDSDFGGGIRNTGTLSLVDVVVDGNEASPGDGGGIGNSGTLKLTRSLVTGNTGDEGGGVWNDAELTVIDSSISSNSAYSSGGAIKNVTGGATTIVGSMLDGNTAGSGGAIQNVTGGATTIVGSTLDGNTAGSGGAIQTDGTLQIQDSTLSGNWSSLGRGGGIHVLPSGSAAITNTTVSGSVADIGGGIDNELGTVLLANVTVTNNSPDGVHNWLGGSLSIKNSIVARQLAGPDCRGAAVSSAGHNIEGSTTCGFVSTGDQQSTDPLLAALGDNGGPTWTHALDVNSPAIDAGDPSGCTDSLGGALLLDQRGFVREVDGDGDFSSVCDVGAYEFGSDILGPCGSLNSLVLMNRTIDTTETLEACETIKTGASFRIESPGNVTFRAGLMVTFDNGFSLESGARIAVELEPSLSAP